MLFAKPIPFQAALDSRKVRALLPTELASRDLRLIAPELKERASFSAKVTRAEVLDEFDRLSESLVQPRRVMRDGVEVTEGLTLPYAREQMRDFLKSIGYAPEPGTEGTIQDLTSRRRLDVKLKTDVQMMQGFGYDQQGQDQAILDQWPAQELYRAVETRVKRDWIERWQRAARAAGDSSALAGLKVGRMVARKDSPIWAMLGSSALFKDGLDNPYPPFAFGSGMDVKDVDRDDAVALGTITIEAKVLPRKRELNEELKVAPDVRSERLRQALLADLGDDFEFVGGVLRRVP
jgi:hypothetical protein